MVQNQTNEAPLRGDPDQRIYLHGVRWVDYERLLAIRGEGAGVRITYLRGEVELMSPSRRHEWINTTIGRLLEAYAEEMGVDLNGYGSWTVKSEPDERGAEPDKCYVLGTHESDRPDLAIEVIWTSGGIDKLEVYRGLGVPEVWFWKDEHLEVYVLRSGSYARVPTSELLPALDLALLVSFLDRPSQTQAVREFRATLRR